MYGDLVCPQVGFAAFHGFKGLIGETRTAGRALFSFAANQILTASAS
jgi:hypothetical protein